MGLKVVELFAGVGGFRLGLRDAAHEVIWWNQWEPSTKRHQYAFDCYVRNFHQDQAVPKIHNTDIRKVPESAIPDHDLLVGGFPCQDFSVASPLRRSRGLGGKRGALWWQIYRIVRARRPPYILLENVDRLLRSPRVGRGRDFTILLACLARLKYAVEWRVVNAADYGQPQRRRRIFLFAANLSTPAGRQMEATAAAPNYLTRNGFFAREFKVVQESAAPPEPEPPQEHIGKNPRQLMRRKSLFPRYENAGVMIRGSVWMQHVDARRERSRPNLRSVLRKRVAKEYYVPDNLIPLWKKAKGAKAVPKTAKSGHPYLYQEGGIPFPDSWRRPSRTLVTSEGSVNPSRMNHIIRDPWKLGPPKYRILTPEECEKLMGFPPRHTKGLPKRWRYFTMGNAVIVPIVERLGERVTSFTKAADTWAKAQQRHGVPLSVKLNA